MGAALLLLTLVALAAAVAALATFDHANSEGGEQPVVARGRRWWSLPWLGGPGDHFDQ